MNSRRASWSTTYDLPKIEENHEAYFDKGTVARSKAVNRLLDKD